MGELKIKEEKLALEKEKNQLEQLSLLLKAQKDAQDAQVNIFAHEADLRRAEVTHGQTVNKHEMDFSKDIAKLLTDIHKHESTQKHESMKNTSKD